MNEIFSDLEKTSNLRGLWYTEQNTVLDPMTFESMKNDGGAGEMRWLRG